MRSSRVSRLEKQMQTTDQRWETLKHTSNKTIQKLIARFKDEPPTSEPFSLESIWKQLREREL